MGEGGTQDHALSRRSQERLRLLDIFKTRRQVSFFSSEGKASGWVAMLVDSRS